MLWFIVTENTNDPLGTHILQGSRHWFDKILACSHFGEIDPF